MNSLFSLTLQDYFVASRWNRPGTANLVELRTTTPFKVWGQENLLRLTIPFRTESELGPGLSDVRVLDLVAFESPSGLWGVGPSLNLGINRGPGIDTLAAGPAVGFVTTSVRPFSLGFLSQNYFSSQKTFSTLQPILALQANRHWSISLGELPLVYNWKTRRFAVFAMGLQLGYQANIADQPVRFFVNPQFNTKSSTQLYQWTVATGFTLPLRATR